MRKRIVHRDSDDSSPRDSEWLDVERLAEVELTSEDAAHPIEAALIPDARSGWRASEPGEQTIRLLFDQPQRIKRIRLLFHEDQQARTQEFVLRSSSDGGRRYQQIVRQQYNFSPPHVTREVEEYAVDLDGVTTLELSILPDISGREARASVTQLRIA